ASHRTTPCERSWPSVNYFSRKKVDYLESYRGQCPCSHGEPLKSRVLLPPFGRHCGGSGRSLLHLPVALQYAAPVLALLAPLHCIASVVPCRSSFPARRRLFIHSTGQKVGTLPHTLPPICSCHI